MKAELLSPAGSYDAARAAVNAGADAIYMGGPLFSARAYAESSERDMVAESIEFCHLRGAKVYLALNTLIKEREFGSIAGYLSRYAGLGIDGVIVQDLGVMRLIKNEFPSLRLHISTQAAVTGTAYAALLVKAGASRLVLARELDLEEIRLIHEASGAELEVFAHGALCFSYSGQCLMSSMIGGRSGNRGRCAGTCRLPFDIFRERRRLNDAGSEYMLSMKDLETAGRLREMLGAGVYSFKIEGRMKSPEYAAASAAVYRRCLDMALEGKSPAAGELREDLRMLRETFERGGTTSGYLDGVNGREMVAVSKKPESRIRDEELMEDIRKKYLYRDRKHPVSMHAVLRKGARPLLRLTSCLPLYAGLSVSAEADYVIEGAGSVPACEQDIRKRLSKLGGTCFEAVSMDVEMDSGIFIPVRVLNELRRQAADELGRKVLGCRTS